MARLAAILILLLTLAPIMAGADVLDLRINELQADNESTLADEYGEHDDWFELVNTGDQMVSLEGLFVTDDLDYQDLVPLDASLNIAVGGRLILWADGQPGQGPAHLSLRLSSTGESLALLAADGLTVIDSVVFGRQFTDRVYQRYPDSTGDWTWGRDPSPGLDNLEPMHCGFLMLNELMTDNTVTAEDEAGDFDPWLEIVNPLPVSIDLAGVTVQDLAGASHTFTSVTLSGLDHLLLWADGEPEEGWNHVAPMLNPLGGVLSLTDSDGQSNDLVVYPALTADQAYARIPDGGTWKATVMATPGEANPTSLEPPVVINELLASNQTGLADETGAFEDWLELHNPREEAVYLSGFTLTDDLTIPDKWTVPDQVLEPGGYLVIWCDNDPEDGPLHANFKLAAGGEDVALYLGDELIDHVSFGVQTADISYGRERDAELPWVFFEVPTPGETNSPPIGVFDLPTSALHLATPHPNPFNPQTTVTFSLPTAQTVHLAVFDVRGRRVRTLYQGALEAGPHSLRWNGQDDGGRSLPSGMYCVNLVAGGEARNRRVMLVR